MLGIRLAELMISSHLLALLVLKGVLAIPIPNPNTNPKCNQPIPALLWKSGSRGPPGVGDYNASFLTNSDVIDIAHEKRKDEDVLVVLDAKV